MVFGFSKKQILVAVIPGQKAPRTLLGHNCFWIIAENHFEMSIKENNIDESTKKILQETLKKYGDKIYDDGIVIYFKNIDKKMNEHY